MEVLIFDTSRPPQFRNPVKYEYMNFMSHYEYMLCTSKQPLGVVDAAELDDKYRRQWRMTWK
jgi:hypothetical protein